MNITEVSMWNVKGRKLEVGKLGEAFIVKAWIDGEPIYGAFGSVEAIEAWVIDFGGCLDTFEGDIVTIELDLAA